MHVRCPLCRQDNHVEPEESLAAITCKACGSTFALSVDEATLDHIGDIDRTRTLRRTPRILGHFQLLERVGVGSFGAVWKARDLELDRLVAVKIPRDDHINDEDADKFLREARAASQLRDPLIVPVYQVGNEDGVIYIVSEFIQGATLAEWLTARRPSPQESAQLGIQIARALQHAHDHGIVHRDLKPGNIMIDMDDVPHLMDFGLARRTSTDVTITVEGQVLGTPAYMSPEQARGDSHRADHRSDIYSLGVVLFQLLTGELPFRGSARMLLVQIVQDDAPSLRKLSNHVPLDLNTICLKCLEKDPDQRYASAGEVADELQRFLNGEPIVARPISSTERAWRWCRRRPALSMTTALLFLVAAAGFAGVTWQWRIAQQNLEESRANLREAQAQYTRAERNREEADRQRERAETNFASARRTLNRFTRMVPNYELLQKPGLESIRANLQELACEYYAELVEAKPDDARVRLELGQAHFFYALTLDNLGQLDKALEQYTAAQTAMSKAREIQSGRVPDEVLDQRIRQNLAACYGNIAGLNVLSGNLDEAIKAFEEILGMQVEMLDENPDDARIRVDVVTSLMNLAFIERDMGALEESLARNREALALTEYPIKAAPKQNLTEDALRERQPHLYMNVGFIKGEQNDLVGGIAAYANAVEIGRELFKKHPKRIDFCLFIGVAERARGGMLGQLKRFEEADACWRNAIAAHRLAVEQAPDVADYRSELQSSFLKYANYQLQNGHPFAAAETLRDSREFADDDPEALFHLACRFGVCVQMINANSDHPGDEGTSGARDRLAQEAVEIFGAAVKKGFADLDAIENASELNALRTRDDFQMTIKRLSTEPPTSESSGKPPNPTSPSTPSPTSGSETAADVDSRTQSEKGVGKRGTGSKAARSFYHVKQAPLLTWCLSHFSRRTRRVDAAREKGDRHRAAQISRNSNANRAWSQSPFSRPFSV